MTLGEDSVGYYQSTYILPSREIVSFKGFLQKPKNPNGSYSFKIQHRILSKRDKINKRNKKSKLEDWIKDTLKLTSKGDLEKNVCVYLREYYEEHFD